ncbi:MAG: CPXCG motif-containing cysteine-rich protein [Flavobacteriales bacterium]|jgi:hypothetical protein
MEEHFFQCPYCWETISMLFDTSINQSQYFEDCEVCCHPIEVNYHRREDESVLIEAV